MCIPSHLHQGMAPNHQQQWDSLKLWNSPKPYSPHCTMGKIDTWGTVSHCTSGGNRWTGIIPIHPICFLSLLSIPSRCTITGNGQTGIIPRCPIGYTFSLLSIIPYITHIEYIWQDAFGGLIHRFYHIRVYNNSIYIYHCKNRLVVLTTKWLHGLFHHGESHSYTSILV